MNFLAKARASTNPSATNMISQISSKSGTTIAHGLKKNNIQTKRYDFTSHQNQNSSKGKHGKRMKSPQRNFDLDRLPEQSLEIFGQLSSAGVSRIHGDKETNSRYQHDLFSLEDEAFLLIFDGILDGFHLNCDHG